jgi:hypothetical protein
MSKKIRITESQLKTIMERRHTYQVEANEEEVTDIEQLEDKDQEEHKVEETPINESIERIKSEFNRFL